MKKTLEPVFNCFALVIILHTLFAIRCIHADVPNEIAYTGRFREYNQPVTGTRTMNFRIYNAATNGTNVWSDDGVVVNVKGGVFTYVLKPSNVDWRGKDYWLETTISGKILAPREKLTALWYALHSRTAEDIEKSAGENIHFMIGGSTIASINSDGNIKNFIPTGTILPYGGTSAPATGWLLCNGQAVSRTTYSDLFAVIGTSFGPGNGSTTFNVPDCRGMVLRGLDNGRGEDPDSFRVVGSTQSDAFQGHTFSLGAGNVAGSSLYVAASQAFTGLNLGVGAPGNDGINGGPRTASETRMKNIAVWYIIKY